MGLYEPFGPWYYADEETYRWGFAQDTDTKCQIVLINEYTEKHEDYEEEGADPTVEIGSTQVGKVCDAVIEGKELTEGSALIINGDYTIYKPGVYLKIGCKYIDGDELVKWEDYVRNNIYTSYDDSGTNGEL